MDGLRADLVRLAAIPSVAFPGFPAEPVLEACDMVAGLLEDAGAGPVRRLEVPGAPPVLLADVPPPVPGAPTVLFYAHYDVQPPGDTERWDSPPFEPVSYMTEHGEALRARGIADDKANIIAVIGMLRAYGGRPPVGVKVVFEGQEEYGGEFENHPARFPEEFACDALVVADVGNVRPGAPTLTTGLRGAADVVVDVRTLDGPVHSGVFGGAAPDALLVLLGALSTLHTAEGDVAVRGLRREPWTGAQQHTDEFRGLAGVRAGTPLMGTGTLGERLWSGPAITVVGLDAPSVDHGASAVVPHARARIALRFHPEQDPVEAQAALAEHLRGQRPFGVPLTVTPGNTSPGYLAATGGPAHRAARAALGEAWGADVSSVATGGTVPVVHALSRAAPDAEVLLFGAQDALANAHAPNERVLLSELNRTVRALCGFVQRYGAHRAGPAVRCSRSGVPITGENQKT
ncbi:M20/M25/M40 family metallo-hydrolase [Streptomyces sp. 150FB]|uniref:M20/M25/M40 family metallo-hydrolase n=1 Tax=Streptomyces sp. 150FB TaxID=1576605 RepID=UPI0006985800|nr:M20/M25/M40 family metallo-hydrolase [Streptomyces sp. 150FB]